MEGRRAKGGLTLVDVMGLANRFVGKDMQCVQRQLHTHERLCMIVQCEGTSKIIGFSSNADKRHAFLLANLLLQIRIFLVDRACF